jgi:hypothetical protein
MLAIPIKTVTLELQRVFLIALTFNLLFSCNETTQAVYGKYKLFSTDPSIQRWFAGEDTYVKLNSDHTIIYNSTMNGKQRFHFEGNFTLDDKTNTLTIQWKAGKLPDTLKIRNVGQEYIIQIGNTTYKKENSSS